MAEFPRCASCRVGIEPGQNVVFRTDGRVTHVECPEVVCPVCDRHIGPGDPIRRNGDELLHGNCWVTRYRAMAGGSGLSPLTVFFDRDAMDEVDEVTLTASEVFAESRALRRYAGYTRLVSRRLRAEAARV